MRRVDGRLAGKLGTALLVALLLALALVTAALAQPVTPEVADSPDIPTLPHFFWGTVFTDKGIPVAPGAEVTARALTGTWTGTFTGTVALVNDYPPLPAGPYYGYPTPFYVPGLDNQVPGSGAQSGNQIAFYVLGVRARLYDVTRGQWVATYPFGYGEHTQLNLEAAIQYTITATAGPNGSISPSGAVVVDYGFSKEFTFTPAFNHQVLDVLVDGVSVGPVTSYTFTNVTANHTIHVTFVRSNYYFTVTAGTGCTIDPPGTGVPPTVTVPYKGSITFSIAPNTGYDLVDVKVDNISQGAVPSFAFTNVDADHTISATCARKQFTITPTWTSGGSISPGVMQTVLYGDSITFSITPDTGYVVDNVLVDGVSVGAPTAYTFTNVTANHTIFASFKIQDLHDHGHRGCGWRHRAVGCGDGELRRQPAVHHHAQHRLRRERRAGGWRFGGRGDDLYLQQRHGQSYD